VDVREGDYLLAIDGREVGPGDNPYQWLVGTTGRPVRLTVNSLPTDVDAREVTVRPIGSDTPLRYWDWVEKNRAHVAEKTDGRVGYVHLPNTATAGYTEFVRGLYAQRDRDGLVVDVRYNGGGFVPEMFIEHLLRPHFNTWVPRDGTDWRTPSVAVHGPKVCIINGYAGSGGDAFPYYFKQFDLGKLVGTTTWGGLVGIDNSLSLLIGGGITAPAFAFVNRDGNWDVERVGVAPDIEVIEPPEARRLGQDPQLDRAIEQVLLELEDWKDPVPSRPETFPVRY
jgi:tricorn protease